VHRSDLGSIDAVERRSAGRAGVVGCTAAERFFRPTLRGIPSPKHPNVFGVPEHWIRAVDARRKQRKTKGAVIQRCHGPDADHARTWTELRARYGLRADPYDPRDTSWPVPRTSVNSTIATARQGFWPPTMQDLDATNVIWRRVDRYRMRRKRTSRRSHR